MAVITRETVPAISVTNLSHAFQGHQALNQVTFCVMPQSLHGFVGPNGAGKTTTLKVICTLLRQNRGEVEVLGHNVRSDPLSVRRQIGYMPDHFSMYRQMTVFEYLDFFAAAYGLPRDEALRAITLYPAQILGVADRVGSLDAGRDATLFVSTGDPLETETQITHAWIQGRKVDLTSRHTQLNAKYLEKYRQLAEGR